MSLPILIDFATILPIWQTQLWPGRISPIEETSAMLFGGGFLPTEHKPVFHAVVEDNAIVGVNSCHITADGDMRSRGLWVSEQYRGQGIGRTLLRAAIEETRSCGIDFIWSVPRKSALSTYLAVGFEQMSKFFDEGMEFGPNCYAGKRFSVD